MYTLCTRLNQTDEHLGDSLQLYTSHHQSQIYQDKRPTEIVINCRHQVYA